MGIRLPREGKGKGKGRRGMRKLEGRKRRVKKERVWIRGSVSGGQCRDSVSEGQECVGTVGIVGRTVG